MSQNDLSQVSSHPPPKKIIDLGEKLATIDSYQAQKTYLERYLQDYFGGRAFIWLRTPPKSILSKLIKAEFPFDPDAITSINRESRNKPHFKQIDSHYWMIVALTRGESDFGKIILQRLTPFDKPAIESIMNISKVSGLAIYATIQAHLQNWRQKKLALVQSVTGQISQITDLNVLTNQITKLVQQSFNYYYVAVFLINEDNNQLHFKASAGSDEGGRPDFERDSHPGFAVGEHIIGYVAKTGSELIANDVKKEPRYKAVNALPETKSEVVIPLKVETRIFGVFDVQSDERNAFDKDDLIVLRALADNIAIAIESTRLYQKVQARADQLAAVSEASRAITYILDIDDLLQRIVTLIHDRFQFPFVHLFTVDTVQRKISFKAGSGKRTPLYSKASVAYDLDAERGLIPWVVKHGETKRINDVSEEPLFRESPLVQQTAGSEMAVPLYFGGEILGVLDIQSDHKNAFSNEDQSLIETLADNIAIAIRNARLYRSEKWRRQVAESLRDVAGLLSENTALDDVFDDILKQLHINLPCDIAGIWLFDKEDTEEAPLEERKLVLQNHQSLENYSTTDLGQINLVPDGWVKHALTQKQPTIRQPDETIGTIAKQFKLEPDFSAIAAPLFTGEEILGILILIHHTPGRYGPESKKITSAFASYAAIAIKNHRLFASSQEQAWISTILLQVAQATQSLTDLKELAATIVRITPMVVGVKGSALFLREPESLILSLYALYGIGDSPEDLKVDRPLPLLDAPILNELLTTQKPLLVKNPGEDFNLPEPFTRQMAKDSLILMPMMSRNELLGAFLLANDAEISPETETSIGVSDERFKIIQGIIQQTAVAVENIRLLEAKQEEAYVSTVLLQVAQAIVSSADLDDTLDSIVNIMPILVGIDASVIYLWNDSEQNFIASHATTKGLTDAEDVLGSTYAPGDFPILDTVHKNNRPIAYPFVENVLPPEDWDLALPDEGQIDPNPILQSPYPILMGFPLSVKDEVFGVLLAEDMNYASTRERRFELLWGIAQQASLAIQNDILNKEMLDRHRLEREFQLAREIQQTFLPSQKPEIPGWELDVRWEPARQVGGDFYDYFLLPDGRLAFVIADVSDKGLAASLYMTVTRTFLRAAALESNSPANTLEHVNERLLVNSQNGLFVTTFYGVLSLEDGTLTYTIAGHNPPLIIRYQTNEVIEFEKGGIALGALPDIQLPQSQVEINPGDSLVLYTDGVTEAFNLQDQMYGSKRLKRVLHTTIGENAHSVLATLEADLKAFRGNAPLSDDTTILALHRHQSLTNDNGNARPA